MNYQSPFPRKR